MSVQSEITRLQNAKTALKTAIEGKGVTVPSSTKLDGYAGLVDSIEAGGGSTLTKFTFSGVTEYLDSIKLKKSDESFEYFQEGKDYTFGAADTVFFLHNIEGTLTITLFDINYSYTYDITLTIG